MTGNVMNRMHPDSGILLTGERAAGRICVRIHGQEVRLTGSLFGVLLDLIHALATTQTGYSRIPSSSGDDPEYVRLRVHRLRREIDQAIGTGKGKELIRTGFGTEYRLAISTSQLAIDASFFDLPPGVVSPEQRTLLRDFSSRRNEIHM